MKIPTNAEVFQVMEEWAPKHKAYDWDNVGLQIGSYNQQAKKIMITLDVLESVVDEAVENNVDLIIAHHPLLFKPLKRININTPEGRIISKLIRHDITVYAAHTNLDVVKYGVNDMLANKLELTETEPLVKLGQEKLYKYAVHVPLSHENEVREALGNAGAGHLGAYSHCAFQSRGKGTFKPLDEADPYIGEIGKLVTVEEVKIEAIVPESRLEKVKEHVISVHPYEEAAFDIIELNNKAESYGLGRIGKVNAVKLERFVEQVKEKLNLSHVRVIGELNKNINKVAVLGGSGEKYISDAKRAGADVYITGDISFHPAQSAWQMGLAVIDAGHYIESVMKEAVQDYLKKEFMGQDTEVIVSKSGTDPFQYL